MAACGFACRLVVLTFFISILCVFLTDITLISAAPIAQRQQRLSWFEQLKDIWGVQEATHAVESGKQLTEAVVRHAELLSNDTGLALSRHSLNHTINYGLEKYNNTLHYGLEKYNDTLKYSLEKYSQIRNRTRKLKAATTRALKQAANATIQGAADMPLTWAAVPMRAAEQHFASTLRGAKSAWNSTAIAVSEAARQWWGETKWMIYCITALVALGLLAFGYLYLCGCAGCSIPFVNRSSSSAAPTPIIVPMYQIVQQQDEEDDSEEEERRRRRRRAGRSRSVDGRRVERHRGQKAECGYSSLPRARSRSSATLCDENVQKAQKYATISGRGEARPKRLPREC